MRPVPSLKEIDKIREMLKEASLERWIHNDLFTWKWWMLVAASIIPWVIWWKVVDKNRISNLFMYGLCFSVIAVILDELGTSFMLWGYLDMIFPIISPLFPADTTIIPVCFMLVYQYFPKGKAFFYRQCGFSCHFCFYRRTYISNAELVCISELERLLHVRRSVLFPCPMLSAGLWKVCRRNQYINFKTRREPVFDKGTNPRESWQERL